MLKRFHTFQQIVFQAEDFELEFDCIAKSTTGTHHRSHSLPGHIKEVKSALT